MSDSVYSSAFYTYFDKIFYMTFRCNEVRQHCTWRPTYIVTDMFRGMNVGIVSDMPYWSVLRKYTKLLRWVIPIVLSRYKYVKNILFVYSHKTQLFSCVLWLYTNRIFFTYLYKNVFIISMFIFLRRNMKLDEQIHDIYDICRSQWPRGLRRGSAATRLLGLWFRIPPGAWKSVVRVVCC